MRTTNDDFSSGAAWIQAEPAPRLPAMPGSRLEGMVHLALGLASVTMFWLLLAAITQFVPRAGVFAARVREAPAVLVSPTYVLREIESAPGGAGAAPLAVEPGANRQTRSAPAACGEPVG